jgi:hypothetical protein
MRDAKSRPLAESFETWLEAQLKKLPEKSDLTKAIRHGLSRAMRSLCIGRKNWMLAGSDRGAEESIRSQGRRGQTLPPTRSELHRLSQFSIAR